MQKILIVEGTPIWVKLLKLGLAKASILNDVAGNGKVAVEKIETDLQAYKGIIMDVEMPLMDGITAASRIRELGFDGPIVGFSSLDEEHVIQKALAAGMDKYVLKSVDKEILQKLLHALGLGSKQCRLCLHLVFLNSE